MKNLILILFFSGIIVSLYAQRPKMGARIGTNMAKQAGDYGDGDMDSPYESRVCFDFGLAAQFPVHDYFNLQPELHWIQKGGKEESDGDEEKVHLNYIEFQVLARHDFNVNSETLSPYGAIGPHLGFAVGGTVKYNDQEMKVTEYYKGTDFGVSFAIRPALSICDITWVYPMCGMATTGRSRTALSDKVIDNWARFLRFSKCEASFQHQFEHESNIWENVLRTSHFALRTFQFFHFIEQPMLGYCTSLTD